MTTALVIGATGFLGRHPVAELLAHDYDVAATSPGEQAFDFDHVPAVDHLVADRTDQDALADVARQASPDVVVDCAAYHPEDVRTAIELFADVDAYVYVSSGGTYAVHEIPKREDGTPLHECTPEQASDTSMATYGPRKAEWDRIATAATDRGVAATSVRPTMIYGPKTVAWPEQAGVDDDAEASTGHDEVAATWADDLPGLQTHHDYWVDQIRRYDRVVVPGDGTAIWHRAYVADVASAIRVVAERGEPGEAYNVGDRRVCTMEDVIELVADALKTSVEVVDASERELGQVGFDPDDFVLYHHVGSRYPHVLDTCKLAALGWTATPVEESIEPTVAESVASGWDGSAFDPGREAEERLLEEVT